MNTPAAGLAQDAALNIVPPSEVSLQAGLLMRQRHILYRRIDALLPEDCCVLRSMQGGTVGSLYQWEPGLDFARATLSGEPVACDILHNAILPVLPGSGWCAEKFLQAEASLELMPAIGGRPRGLPLWRFVQVYAHIGGSPYLWTAVLNAWDWESPPERIGAALLRVPAVAAFVARTKQKPTPFTPYERAVLERFPMGRYDSVYAALASGRQIYHVRPSAVQTTPPMVPPAPPEPRATNIAVTAQPEDVMSTKNETTAESIVVTTTDMVKERGSSGLKTVAAVRASDGLRRILSSVVRKHLIPEEHHALLDSPLGRALLDLATPTVIHALAQAGHLPKNDILLEVADRAFEGNVIRYGLAATDKIGEALAEFGPELASLRESVADAVGVAK